MPVYTVHAPVGDGADFAATDRYVFARDGFHFWAALFGPLWLLRHRLWLALLGWIALTIALEAGTRSIGAGPSAVWLGDLLVALLLGFEAGNLQRWTLSRRKWRQVDIVVADDEESAERRFFDRWTDRQRGGFAYDPSAVDRGGPPPTRNVPGQPFSKPPPLPQGGIIGSFPEPGGYR